MNPFDSAILSFVNSFAHRWFVLDATMALMVSNNLIKGGVITALIWWGWFRASAKQNENREILSCGVLCGFLSLFLARTLADVLPFRERPVHDAAAHFRLPYLTNESIIHWSSFPSDHATLFFALALSIFFVSRRAGIAAMCYAFFMVCLPRVYMGFHYPTDILAGAAIGVGTASLVKVARFRALVARPVMRWLEKSPGLFYTGFFLLTFQIAITFDSVRQIGRYLLEVAQALRHGAP